MISSRTRLVGVALVVTYSNSRLKEKVDAADAVAVSARTALENVLEEGRRAGALPGWLR